jgi:lipopolysaccharide export system ATP-binding protein
MTTMGTPAHGVILADDSDAAGIPPSVRQLVAQLSQGNRSIALVLAALMSSADQSGRMPFNSVAIAYRDAYIAVLRAEGRDADHESERLSLDEVRDYLSGSLLPRLQRDHIVLLPPEGLSAQDAPVRIAPGIWDGIGAFRAEIARALRAAEARAAGRGTSAAGVVTAGSVLEATGLLKVYKGRKVVNDVALHLRQGEIVGMLGPNGAGKTTTFYMIVGLIPPAAGRIVLDGEDITDMPMYRRARRGIGYLSQEPSIFRKLTVEDNIRAILEMTPLSAAEQRQRLELLLDELSIKHLRKNKAYSLSGGERRRLEITRALVTQPKFMMLDEPFAGVDPIAVHDIQTIVSGLRHRGIGVLISDHNVEQTLDIVDRAYIMFDGQVKVSGTVRDLVFDDTVAEIYLGPTLTARLRARFAAGRAAA